MYEIYQEYSFEYDELVSCEDYRKNLPEYLNRQIDLNGKTVLEFGSGMGRMTGMYAEAAKKVVCFDRSAHMLERAKTELAEYGSKVEFGLCNNLDIDSIDLTADIVIEGWSFGHTVSDDEARIEETVAKLVTDCSARLNVGGSLLFFESLGTNTESPAAPNESLEAFYSLLEGKHGFKKTVLETDYCFNSNEEAMRIMGFFFGPEMGRCLKFAGDGIVREYTGAWHLKK
jgi:SAM-dependent methyltransferase